jgi:hypothetical protein
MVFLGINGSSRWDLAWLMTADDVQFNQKFPGEELTTGCFLFAIVLWAQ